MQKLGTIGVAIALTLFAGPAAASWYNSFTIKELRFTRGADVVHVLWEGGSGNPNGEGCDSGGQFILRTNSSNPDREERMVAALLSAYSAGKTVRVLLSGCTAGIGGSTSYPSIWYLYLK